MARSAIPSTASPSPTRAPAATAGPSRSSAATTRRKSRASSRSTPSGPSTGSGSALSPPSRSWQLLKITGDWQKFKGLPGAEGTLKVKEPKPSKLDLFNAALAEADGGPSTEATTPKKKKAPAKKAAKAEEPAAATEAEAQVAPIKDESEPAAEGADAAAPAEPTEES